MKYIIYDINFDNFNIKQTETLDQFLNDIDNLHSRDIRFLCSSTRLSYFAIRDKIIVLKLDFIKSIITNSNIYIIKNSNDNKNFVDFREQNYEITLDNIKLIFNTIKQKNTKKNNISLKQFGLESILSIIEQYFSNSVNLLLPKVNRTLEEINLSTKRNELGSSTNFNTFLKIQNELIDVEFRVKEVYNIIEELEEDLEKLENDDDKEASQQNSPTNSSIISLDSNHLEENDELEEILGTYNNFINQILSEIQKYSKEMNSTKEYISMLMAQRRNDIAYINVYTSFGNLCISFGMLFSSYFGMNLLSNLENSNEAFISVILITLLLIMTLFYKFHRYITHFKN
jgi:hypothetical protein